MIILKVAMWLIDIALHLGGLIAICAVVACISALIMLFTDDDDFEDD